MQHLQAYYLLFWSRSVTDNGHCLKVSLLQGLASYAEKPGWVNMFLLNYNKRNSFAFSLQIKALKRLTQKVMFGELFH